MDNIGNKFTGLNSPSDDSVIRLLRDIAVVQEKYGEPKNKTFFSKICNIEREYNVVEVVLKALAFIVYCFTVILPIHDLYVTLKHRISLCRVESKKECFQKKMERIAKSEEYCKMTDSLIEMVKQMESNVVELNPRKNVFKKK